MKVEIDSRYIGERVDRVLLEVLKGCGIDSITRSVIQENMKGGCTVNGGVCKKSYKLREGDIFDVDVKYWEDIVSSLDLSSNIEPQERELDIRYEDDDLMVIFKPKGMVVHPGVGNKENTLSNYLRYYLESRGEYDNLLDRCGIVHRLDKGVSGLMVVAKSKSVQEYLKRQFQEHEVVKIYYAQVQESGKGSVSEFKESVQSVDLKEYLRDMDISKEPWSDWFKIEGYVGRSSKNRYKMEFKTYEFGGSRFASSRILNAGSELLIKIDTGRMHQIRCTLEYLGLGIIGDSLYGKGESSDSIMLESVLLSFVKPDGNRLTLKI